MREGFEDPFPDRDRCPVKRPRRSTSECPKATSAGEAYVCGTQPRMAAVITLEAFASAELAKWLNTMLVRYIDERVAAGESVDEAQEMPIPSTCVCSRTARHLPISDRELGLTGSTLGALWIGPAATGPDSWWIWEVIIDAEFRGRGVGHQATLLAEENARTNGASTLGLNVYGHNKTVACRRQDHVVVPQLADRSSTGHVVLEWSEPFARTPPLMNGPPYLEDRAPTRTIVLWLASDVRRKLRRRSDCQGQRSHGGQGRSRSYGARRHR